MLKISTSNGKRGKKESRKLSRGIELTRFLLNVESEENERITDNFCTSSLNEED